jgi:glyoxylase-like metal-dependent hydrolase (beta-lactamase superfamily II)
VEVADGVHRIETALGERINCLYVFTGSQAAAVFDTGVATTVRAALLGYLETIGYDPHRIRYVVNSHCDWDHTGGNGVVTELAPRALLMCHELDRPMVEDVQHLINARYGEFRDDHGVDEPAATKKLIHESARLVPVDVSLRGGERLHLGDGWHVEVLHTPGHSRGHLSIYDPRSRALAIGDATLGTAVPFADGSPAFPPTYRYVDSYVETIELFEAMTAGALLTSHYPVYEGDQVGEFLALSRAYVDRIDAELRGLLADRPGTMRELIEQLGPGLGTWPAVAHEYLVHPFAGHLERLERDGRVRRTRASGARVGYRWTGHG